MSFLLLIVLEGRWKGKGNLDSDFGLESWCGFGVWVFVLCFHVCIKETISDVGDYRYHFSNAYFPVLSCTNAKLIFLTA